jgi:hypothetical protein
MNSQSSAGLAINAPGAKATPQNGQTTKKLVMRPLKCKCRGLLATAAAQDCCSHHRNTPLVVYDNFICHSDTRTSCSAATQQPT